MGSKHRAPRAAIAPGYARAAAAAPPATTTPPALIAACLTGDDSSPTSRGGFRVSRKTAHKSTAANFSATPASSTSSTLPQL